jgi:hypothetical protein
MKGKVETFSIPKTLFPVKLSGVWIRVRIQINNIYFIRIHNLAIRYRYRFICDFRFPSCTLVRDYRCILLLSNTNSTGGKGYLIKYFLKIEDAYEMGGYKSEYELARESNIKEKFEELTRLQFSTQRVIFLLKFFIVSRDFVVPRYVFWCHSIDLSFIHIRSGFFCF